MGRDGLTPAATLVPGVGYFVFNPEAPRFVQIAGERSSGLLPTLADGWNLIGPQGLPPYPLVPIAAAIANPDALVPPSYELRSNQYAKAHQLESGHGYWAYGVPPALPSRSD